MESEEYEINFSPFFNNVKPLILFKCFVELYPTF